MRYKIAIDLDGVLADFDSKVKSLLGESWKLLHPNVLWKHLGKEDNLFDSLQLMEDAHKLVTHLMHHDLFILTAIPRPSDKLASAALDKKNWVARHINKNIPVQTVLGGKNKAKFVEDHNSILIDDYPRNINAWKAAGGIGILHTSVDETLKELEWLKIL